ncbi:MAG: hypothetical protein WBA61_11270 [Aequorivita sp.]
MLRKKIDKADNSSAIENQNVPRGTWKVNKEVDENGNLIRYDSIYTYSYGNINGQEIPPKELDSALASFQEYMQDRMPPGFAQGMIAPFEMDSLRDNFFEKGVFENHWEDFFPELKQQLQQMDSLHQQFFDNVSPGIFPLEEKDKHGQQKS